jgi:hypothetical protein
VHASLLAPPTVLGCDIAFNALEEAKNGFELKRQDAREDCEGWRVIGCDTVWLLVEPTFRRNGSPPSSGSKELASEEQR